MHSTASLRCDYECDFCHRQFKNKKLWKNHMKTHGRDKRVHSIPTSLMKDKKCSICLEPKVKDIAGISCCKHSFHFECIKQWSQIANQCPFCKIEFEFIVSLPSHQLIRVEHRSQKLDRNDLSEALLSTVDDEWADKECVVCKSNDSEHDDLAMICDGCNGIYHTFCIGLDAVPDDEEWFCPQCNQSMVDQAESMKFDQIAEDQKASHCEEAECTMNGAAIETEDINDDEDWTPQ